MTGPSEPTDERAPILVEPPSATDGAPAAPAPAATGTATDADPRPGPAPSPGAHRPSGAINPGPVEYKGQPLDAERGPGLGCFRFQLILLVLLILATPLSVGRVPDAVTAFLLFATIGLLLVSGQTIIFLLRLVAADRRGRRQPLASSTPTVGQLEDASAGSPEAPSAAAHDDAVPDAPGADALDDPGTGPSAAGPVRQ